MSATGDQRERWRQLASEATKGPWVWRQVKGMGAMACLYAPEGGTPYNDWSPIAIDVSGNANADFIAAAREAVPALLTALESAESRIRELEANREKLERRWQGWRDAYEAQRKEYPEAPYTGTTDG